MKCIVCKKDQKLGKISYSFPNDESLRKKWMEALQITELDLSSGPSSVNSCVCEDHFPSHVNWRFQQLASKGKSKSTRKQLDDDFVPSLQLLSTESKAPSPSTSTLAVEGIKVENDQDYLMYSSLNEQSGEREGVEIFADEEGIIGGGPQIKTESSEPDDLQMEVSPTLPQVQPIPTKQLKIKVGNTPVEKMTIMRAKKRRMSRHVQTMLITTHSKGSSTINRRKKHIAVQADLGSTPSEIDSNDAGPRPTLVVLWSS